MPPTLHQPVDFNPRRSRRERQTPAAAVPQAHLEYLPALPSVPLKLVRLGISAWSRLRQRESASERQAMDAALAEFGWDLAEEMRDSAIMKVPEFKRARRSESCEAAAAHSGRMEGERRCVMLL